MDGPLKPEQALAGFRLDPGLKIECVASEPVVVSPVAMAWDESGRMYVVEDRGYPTGPAKGQKPAGQIVRLKSSRHDGRYDKRTVFADGLTFPNGVMCWKGGVFVTCAPYLYYFKDTNGDGVADVKQIVFQGFQDQSTTEQRVSHPVLNIDNWIYLTSGLTSAKVSSPLYPNHPAVECFFTDFRFRPDTDHFEAAAGTAQFGETFDNFGRKFICSNRNHNQAVMFSLKYANRNPYFTPSEIVADIPDHGAAAPVYPLSANITTSAEQAGYFTSACGIFYYRGAALPVEYRDNSFTCEPAGNLVHRDVISPAKSTFVARRAREGVEFLASPDNWFRPVNVASGPDGALYVCDMYRKTIEHPDYLPEAVRKVTDFDSGKDKGRIYRITAVAGTGNLPVPVGNLPTGTNETGLLLKRSSPAKSSPSPSAGPVARRDGQVARATPADAARGDGEATEFNDLSRASTKQLCYELNNPDGWWRSTAQRLLLERKDAAAAPLLKTLSRRAKKPETRVAALQLLAALGALKDQTIDAALDDSSPGVRENALQLAEPRLNKSPKLAAHVLALADDENARVRFQCALTLGELNDVRVAPALAKITARDADDPWTRDAVLTAVGVRANELLHMLLAGENKSSAGASAMLMELCRILGASGTKEQLSSLVDDLAAPSTPADVAWQQAAFTGLADGLPRRAPAQGGRLTLNNLINGDIPTVRQTHERVEFLIQRSGETAKDPEQPVERRVIAIRFLAEAAPAKSATWLQNLVEPRQPAEIQVASISALGAMREPAAMKALLSGKQWAAYSPPVREAVLDVVMSKPGLISQLLDAVASGDIPARAVNQDRRDQLLGDSNAAIKARAAALFKTTRPGDRMKVYEEYKSILSLTPNPRNGHAVFTRTCSGCHVFAGEGHLVGPDLTGIRNQPGEVLLLHIIVPEYEIAPTYTCYQIETKDGNSFTGLLSAETPTSITLRQALGREEKIERGNIATMTSSRFSLMPDELEKTMTRQELADLIGFLRGM